ncbi:hypothetical protein D3C86_1160510 [compost metagenome]
MIRLITVWFTISIDFSSLLSNSSCFASMWDCRAGTAAAPGGSPRTRLSENIQKDQSIFLISLMRFFSSTRMTFGL